MASKHLLILVTLSLISSTLQDGTDNKVDSKDDESPLADVAKEILKEKNLENIGGMVNGFIQSGGAKQIMDSVLQNLASGENSGKLLENLGSFLNSASDGDKQKAKKSDNGEINPMDVISGLGSLVGALQGGGGAGGDANPAALLQGLGSILAGANNQGGGDNSGTAALLQGLGSLLGSAAQDKGKKDSDDSGANLLQGLGSVIGAAIANQAGGGDNNPGASLLQGLGSLLGGTQGGQGGINPEMIGNVINMFTNSDSGEKKQRKPSKAASKKAPGEKSKAKKTDKSKVEDDSFNLEGILNMASTFLNQGGNGKASDGPSFMDYLPVIVNTINAFTGPEAQERADSHSEHSWILPPVLEKIHVYYDNFLNSDMGKQTLNFINHHPTFKAFMNDNGNFSYEKFETLIENHSFRKHWISQVVDQLVDFLQILSNEKIYNQYVQTGIMFTNSYLKNAGFPKKTFIDPKKLAKSIIKLANYVVKEYLGSEVDAREYIEPVVFYVQDTFNMVQQSIPSGSPPEAVTDKLTNTINMEIIEPITRVNRAYRFIKSQPKCDKYVLCHVNKEVTSSSESLPNLKKGLYKGFSLIASWFISSNTGTSYTDLYIVITENKKCKAFYHDRCSGFHEEEIKVTTEYAHNEL